MLYYFIGTYYNMQTAILLFKNSLYIFFEAVSNIPIFFNLIGDLYFYIMIGIHVIIVAYKMYLI